MADAGSIWVSLRLKADEFMWGIDKARYKLTEWRDDTNRSTQDMAKWGAALAATVGPILAVGTAAYVMTNRLGSVANQIKDLSYTTGIGTDKIQKMQYAAALSNTEFSAVSTTLNRLSLSIDESRDSSTAAAEAFSAMGIDPSGKSLDQVFDQIADKLVSMQNATERNALAAATLGKNWKEVLPYMETYTKKKKEIEAFTPLTDAELNENVRAKAELNAFGLRLENLEGNALSSLMFMVDMNQAYQKLFRGDVAGFMQAAKDTREKMAGEPFKGVQPTGLQSSSFIDKYAGLSTKELELVSIQEKLTEAQEEYNKAMVGGDEDAFNTAARNLQDVKNQYAALKDEIYGVTDATNALVEANRNLKSITDSIASENQSFDLTTEDFLSDVAFAGPDVQQVRSLAHAYEKAGRHHNAAVAAKTEDLAGLRSSLINQQNVSALNTSAVPALQMMGMTPSKTFHITINAKEKTIAQIIREIDEYDATAIPARGY